MKIVETTFERLPRERLEIGFEGENLRATVRIDCASVFAEYPNATPALIIKPLFADAYPVVVDRNGTDVDWLITSEILSFSGDGEIQLVFYKDQVICKSAVSKIRVSRSLTVTGDMPDPVVQWIENANRKLAEVDAQIVELEGMVDTATDAATRAEQSASNATTAAANAATSAATATAKANEATQAAGTATAKAAEAQTAAQTAIEKANAAAESERTATAKAGDATTAAGTATAKAEQATDAAQTATEKAGDASASATAAQASATNAASSATAASASETAAQASETAAGASATQAAQSAQTANTASQTATQKAAEASQSASNAATSATNAATSAETASTKAGEAAQSAQAVTETAEQLADSLEQIDQNTQDIAELDERKANIDGYYPDMTVGNAEQLNSSKYVENSEPYTLRTSGGTSDIGNREYLDAVVGGTLAWNQVVRDEASENSTDFAPIVTVTDAVEDAAGVKVKIEPVQDLHGYDHPWPGGGSANKWDEQWEKGTYSTANGTKTYVDNQIRCKNLIPVIPGQTYYAKNVDWAGFMDADGNIVETPDVGITNVIRSNNAVHIKNLVFTVPQTAQWMWFYNLTTYGNVYKNDIAINNPSTVTDYAPYSNICPITGWDGVQVWDDPKHGGLIEWNQLVNGYWARDTTKGLITAESGSGYSVAGTVTTAFDYNFVGLTNLIRFHRDGRKYLITVDTATLGDHLWRVGGYSAVTLHNGGFMFTQTANADWNNNVGVNIELGETVNDTGIIGVYDLTQMFGATKADEIYAMEQANAGSGVAYFRSLFSADYYPYNAGEITTVSAVNGDPYRHYSITLPTEAGTVYGGELTVNADGSGSLVVDRGIYIPQSADGMQIYNYQDNHGVLFINCLPNNLERANGLCSHSGKVGLYLDSNSVWLGVNSQNIYWIGIFDILGISTLEEFKNWLDTQTVQFVYPLTTPITFTLTASEIRTLLGTNNVWADTGDLALTYTGTDEHLTLESGKKYLSRISGTDSMLLGSGQEITATKGTDNVFDLTQMFGTAVADYVYGQGASFFRRWFPNARYPYNAGELKHVEGLSAHDMTGFNQWDEEWRNGYYNITTGVFTAMSSYFANKNPISVKPSTSYYIGSSVNATWEVLYYDSDMTYLSYDSRTNAAFTTPSNCAYINFNGATTFYGNTYNHDICINLSHNGSRKGEYEPYEKHSYPLDSTVILRGIPKVGANGVYWDGDRYLPDGTVERRYGVVDLGTLEWQKLATSGSNFRFVAPIANGVIASTASIVPNMLCTKYTTVTPANTYTGVTGISNNIVVSQILVCDMTYADAASFKAAMQGVLLVYELATPITETAQPYHSTQWVSDWGTEEFVSTGLVPVGHETRYPANLRDKLQHLPDAASGNGSYLITQTDGQMVLTPFPAPPSSAGNYVLKATVVNGVATYTWEVAT